MKIKKQNEKSVTMEYRTPSKFSRKVEDIKHKYFIIHEEDSKFLRFLKRLLQWNLVFFILGVILIIVGQVGMALGY